MKGFCLLLAAVVVLAAGCSSDYAPSAGEAATAAVAKDTVKDSAAQFIGNGEVFDLEAVHVLKEINGIKYDFYGYNGMVPGPILKVAQGSSIAVNFTNKIDMPTTIHWHGLRHSIKDDGVPFISQQPVQSGESHLYSLKFPDAGVFWYHPHMREDIQQDRGLAGVIIISPKKPGYYSPVSSEEILVLDDVLIEEGKLGAYGVKGANHAIMGRFGNVMLVNGKTDYSLSINKGDVVRFYILNAANTRTFNISFGDARFKLVGSDISKYAETKLVDGVVIAPGERYIAEAYFTEAGNYDIMHITPVSSYKIGEVVVADSSGDGSHSFEAAADEELLTEISSFASKDVSVEYELELDAEMPHSMQNMQGNGMPCHRMSDGTMMGDCDEEKSDGIEWEDDMGQMNAASTTEEVKWIILDTATGKENIGIVMSARVGDKIRLIINNRADSMHPMQHPIHLHGQRFLVAKVDGKDADALVWKDTVLIPKGSVAELLVDVTNPGEWMLHCHIPEHLEAGMAATLKVA